MEIARHPVPAALSGDLDDLAPAILTRADLGRIDTAAEIVARAEEHAKRWDDGARTRFRTARKEGHAAGHDEATKALLAERIDLAARIQALKAAHAKELNGLLVDAVTHFFGTAPWPELMRNAVDQALRQSPAEECATLAAAPDDLARLTEIAAARPWPVDLVEDASLPAGEVELRTLDGIVCISLARHLEHLVRALAQERRDDG